MVAVTIFGISRRSVSRTRARVAPGSVDPRASTWISPSVVEAEREVIAFWDSLFSHPYRWLVEHAENGLPSLDLTSKTLSSMGYHLHILQHGDIRLWKEFIKGHFSEVCVGALKPVLSILYKYYEDVLFEQDFCSTETYRKFIFCSRDPLIVENIKAVFKSLENKPSPEVRQEVSRR